MRRGRFTWLGLASLTLTCAKPGPPALAHAEAPHPAGAQAPSLHLGQKPSPRPAKPPSRSEPTPPPRPEGSLTGFFTALHALHDGSRQDHVRVLWLGDSHTNADFLSGAVRSALQASFGDGGPGFVRVGTRPYRHDGVKLAREGSWDVDPNPPARRALQDDGVFGLGGTRAEPKAGAAFSLQVSSTEGAGEPARFVLAYSLPPGSAFNVELAGRKLRVDGATAADATPYGVLHLALTAPFAAQLLLTPLRGAPRFFDVVVEREGKPGVVLDAAGIDGARLETPLAWNEAAFVAEVARRAPELLVVAYGTNEAFDAVKVDKYGPQLGQLVRRVREGAPLASCLVLGPTDAPLGDGSVPRVAEVSAALQKSATALGCSFVSLQQLMGGEGSFAKGMKAKERLAQPDKLHLTPKGYRELGAALAKLLLGAYSAGRADL